MISAPAPPASPGPRRPDRRPWYFAGLGISLAAVLAVVLFAGIGTGKTSKPSVDQQVTRADLQPGINRPTSLLLSLTVFPSTSHPLAPTFELTDQQGRPVSMNEFRGKVVVFSANDDQCEDLCTLLANDIVVANHDLGPAARDVVWLSVNANPFYPQVSAVKAWTDQHGLADQPNWYFGTGAPSVLEHIWNEYGIVVEQDAKTRTVNHGTELFFVDPSGHERSVAEFGTAAANTSFYAHGVAQMADDLLPKVEQVKVAGPETPSPTSNNTTVSATSPDFTLPYLENGEGEFRLSADRSRYVVVNFWSSTCTVCRAELPQIEAAYRFADSQVDFVGVDVADGTGPAEAMAARANLTYPLVADREGTAAGDEQITGLPFTIILSPKGQVMVRHPGNLTTEQLEYILESYDQALPTQG